jgi:predicted metal-dependent phosphoesterase TrpH
MSAMPDFDLQAHSIHSDGALAPGEVVAGAAAAGIALLALTDHDTVDGVDEALEAGARLGVRVIPAAEISALDPETTADFHILGYDFDHHAPELTTALSDWRADRANRASHMADALHELGFQLDTTDLDARHAAGAPIGRPHLAAAAFAHPANAQRLADEHLADASQLLVAYLIEGRPAFRTRTRPTIGEAVDTIHAAGGLAVWAHPFWDLDQDAITLATLERFTKDYGIDGVEAFYATHTAAQTRLLVEAADRTDLLTTGSSDFHGPNHPQFAAFGAFALHGLTPRLGRLRTDSASPPTGP